jgi:hypothetical protein
MNRFPENGYGPLYHALLARLFYVTSGNSQVACILTVMNCTEGVARDKREPAPEWSQAISSKEFAAIANCSVSAVERAVDDAVERGLLIRMGERCNQRWRYKVPVAAFCKLPDYEEAKPVAAPPATKAPKAKPYQLSGGPLVLMPGSDSRPIPLETAVRERLEGVQLHNQTDSDGSCEAFVGADNMLHFVWLRPPPKADENTASTLIFASSSPPPKADENTASTLIFASSSPPNTDLAADVTASLQALCQQIHEYVNPLFRKYIGHDIDEAYVDQLAAKLSEKHQTVAGYIERAKPRLKRAAQNGGVQSGLFGRIADDLRPIRIDPAQADLEAKVRAWDAERRRTQ